MIPDTVFKSRRLLRAVCCCVIALPFLFSPTGNTAPSVQMTTLGYCLAGSGNPVAYFSAIYDTRLRHPARIGTTFIAREFVEYLNGRYNFKSGGSFPSGCPIFNRLGDAEASRRDFMAKAHQANHQVVETGWKFVADDDMIRAAIEILTKTYSLSWRGKRKSVNTFCLSDSSQGTLYLAGPVDTGPAVNLSYWYRGFDQLVATLVAAHKLNCAECIDNTGVSLWVENRAAADKLSSKATNCVSQNVIVTLYKTPEASLLREFYKDAVATCIKQ